MRPNELIEILIQADGPVCVRSLIESSVHLPNRSSRWVAAYRDENGQPVWRATGARDKKTAMAKARQWEEEARRKREAQPAVPRKPTIRVRPGSAERELGFLSQREVALILKISVRSVRAIEKRAFYKLEHHPALRDFWREYTSGEVVEAASPDPRDWALSQAEVAAVYALARTPAERQALAKLLALTQGGI
jgi:hypothetical protein